ncbi:MAG: hypothetical protein QOI43_2385 [Gaiellales bacterium]|nr:hypothetical protein [Gaiellales bacterium]
MEAVNIFSAENLEGRVDVARAAGSTETAMFIYDLEPGQSSCPYYYGARGLSNATQMVVRKKSSTGAG